MTMWMIRAGGRGEHENLVLEKGVAAIGWEELPDLSTIKSREELAALLLRTFPDAKPKTLSNWESQIWPIMHTIEKDNLVVLPMKGRATIAVGRVTGPYEFRLDLPPGAQHARPVEWIGEFPREKFGQDLRYSMGAFLTVCRIQRNDAEERVRAIIEGKPDPLVTPPTPDQGQPDDVVAPLDLEDYARDQIRDFVGRKFKGHTLSDLVAAVLTAQGYKVRRSPAGPDGGVDIIAGQGPLGFDSPRLAVQVKSSDSPVDVTILRELQGVMKNFGADQGLLVAWGGWKSSVDKEAARLFFEVRLWDAADLVRMLQANYDQLPDDLQAELPLKRIWALVLSEEE